jgi:hypothetical protein
MLQQTYFRSQNKRRVKTMQYAKPELTPLKDALLAIQGNPAGSKMGGPSDHRGQVTANAYEADE